MLETVAQTNESNERVWVICQKHRSTEVDTHTNLLLLFCHSWVDIIIFFRSRGSGLIIITSSHHITFRFRRGVPLFSGKRELFVSFRSLPALADELVDYF